MRPITKLTMFAFAASAFAAPAFAADMFLKLGPVKGESSDRAARGKVQLSSFTFSASRKGWDGTIKGNPHTAASDSSAGAGAGKVNMQDMSVMRGPRQTTAADGVQVAAGEESATAGAGGGSGGGGGGGAGKVSMQDMNVTTNVASPGDAASGMPTGKRQHGSVTITKPLDRGSVTVHGNLPGCTVGAAYADAVLQTPATRYELKEVMISSCTMSGSTGGDDAPTESVTLDYASYRESPTRQSQK